MTASRFASETPSVACIPVDAALPGFSKFVEISLSLKILSTDFHARFPVFEVMLEKGKALFCPIM